MCRTPKSQRLYKQKIVYFLERPRTRFVKGRFNFFIYFLVVKYNNYVIIINIF